MGKTSIYKLGYIEPRQKTAEIPTLDRERFETIERQLKWLFSLFGNGIIEDDPANPSWRIQNVAGDNAGTQVQITPGRGHVAWKSAVTSDPVVINLPAPPSLGTGNTWAYWLYAEADTTTHYKQTVRFFASNVEIDDPDRYVGLGGVIATLGSNGITLSPQNTTDYGRTVISLFSTLASIINRHRHIGGANNPSPIDLGQHVQGKLSGDFVENLDLNKVTRGTLAPERLPVISHKSLADIGTLEHKEIDSLLAAIELGSQDRLSDLFGVNYMQIVLAEKKIAGREDIDSATIAALFYVPGITPDSYVAYYDNYASYGLEGVAPLYVPSTVPLATIDKDNREIRGNVSSPVHSDAVAWVSRQDFDDALGLADARTLSATPATQFVEVVGDGAEGGFTIERPLQYRGVTSASLDDFVTGYRFTDRITKLPADTTPKTSISDDYDVRRHVFKEFPANQDWSENTKLVIAYNLGADNEQGDVYAYLLLGAGGESEGIRLTDGTEKVLSRSQLVKIHDRDDPPGDGLHAVLNLLEFTGSTDLLVKIAGVGLAWDTETGWDRREVNFALAVPADEDFGDERVVVYRAGVPDYTSSWIIWNDLYYAPTARLVLRLDSNYDLTQYDTVGVTSSLESQTRVLTRVADDEAGLGNSTRYPLTGGYISASGNSGRWIDIIVELQRSTNKLTAPFVDDVTLSFRSPGASQSKTWDRKVAGADYERVAAWEKATTFLNVVCDPDTDTAPNSIKLLDSGAVGQWLFARDNTVYADFETGGNPEEIKQDGSQLYITPMQVWAGSTRRGFDAPTDVSELSDGRWIVADTGNDRVASLNSGGGLVQSVQGNIRLRKVTRAWAALTAVYNPRVGKMWVALSQNTTVADKTKMSLVSDLDTVSFAGSDVNVVLFGADSAGKSATLEIRFSDALVSKINAWTNPMRLIIGDGALANAGVSTGDERDPGAGEGGDGGSSAGTPGGGGRDTGGGAGGGPGGLSTCGLPDYLTSDLYRVIGTGEFALDATCPLSGATGLPAPDADEGDGVFDPSVTRLQGPGAQVGAVTLDIFRGEVVFDNLYAPVSVQETASEDWVVGTSGNRSVIGYGPDNVRLWTISASTVSLSEGLGGSAFELDGGNILIAAPDDNDDGKGKLVVVNRGSGNTPVISLDISGDVVRAVPDPDGVHFWAAVYDRTGDGRTSRLMRVTAAGVTDWLWGIGILVKPTGLRYMENGHLLVSE